MQNTQQTSLATNLKHFFTTLSTKKAIFIIVIVGSIVYFNSLFNGFVGDDQVQLVANTTTHSLINILSFFTGSTFYNGGAQLGGYYFKPLLNTYFSFIYSFWGPNYFFFHLFQIVLHISNTILIFFFLKHFFRKSLSFFLSLIFLIHPINSEAVFYISAIQEVLFFFFGILALYITTRLRSQKQLIFIVLCLLLSLFSKETGVLFTVVVIMYTLFFNRKFLFSIINYSAVLFIIYFALRKNAIGIFSTPANAPIDRLSLLERLLNIPSIILFYLKTFIFPINLSSSYLWAYTKFNVSNFLLPFILDVLFLVVMIYLGFLLYKSRLKQQLKLYVFFSFWFLIGLLIHLQIFPLDATAADRWFYFPIAGLLGMIGVILSALQVNLKSKWIISVVLVILLLLSSLTFLRSFDWKDDNTLANHDIKISKDSYVLENTIGSDLIDQNKLPEAKVHIEKSIKLYPYLTNYLNLGVIYMRLGEYMKAEDADLHALKYYDYYVVYDNLAELTLVSGDPIKGINLIKEILRKFPQDGKLWLYLSILDYRMKYRDEARVAVQKAYYYGAGQGTNYVYNTIMNDEPLNLKFSEGQQ